MSQPRALLAVLTPAEKENFFPNSLWDDLRAVAGSVATLDPTALDAAEFARQLAQADPDVLVGCWRTPMLPAALPPRLRYICYLAGSVKSIVTRRHLEDGLLLTNWGGAISRVVAEAALLHILACLRRATRWTFAMHREGAWKNGVTDAASLFERRVGLHGFGPVARELTRLLRPFNCTIQVFAPDVDHVYEREYGVRRAASLEALFAESDVLVEIAPLIPATAGIVSEKLLRLLPPGSVFVNVGRGAVVDEDALVRVAREGRIQFGLDVFAREPLAPDHPLRGLPNVFLTPHLGGPTVDRYSDATALALRNLRAYAEGLPLEAIVTPEVYDRST
ncbi:MAG TPA: hydroxyacid dehydrogenase [Opitutaceae bacterium]|nr:hydroxyacid dehydrogenase [Opitutaceae bacterium]